MKLYEKITKIKEEKGLKQMELYRRIQAAFAAKAIDRRTLTRIISGLNEPTGQSLYQISIGLGVSIQELYQGTEEESDPIQFIPKNKPQGRYNYTQEKGKKASYADILCAENLKNMLAQKLTLAPGTKTRPEKNFAPNENATLYQKWIYMIKGVLTCVIDGREYLLKKGDSLHFESRLTHYFENKTNKLGQCLIVQSPREI